MGLPWVLSLILHHLVHLNSWVQKVSGFEKYSACVDNLLFTSVQCVNILFLPRIHLCFGRIVIANGK
jgi:hypothetical protein